MVISDNKYPQKIMKYSISGTKYSIPFLSVTRRKE